MEAPGRLLTVATFAGLCLIWGTTWAVIRIGLEGIPPLTGVAARFAVASLLLLGLGRLLGLRLGASRAERALWLVNGLLAFSASYGVVYWAEQWIPSGLAAVLFATYPLMVALLSHFVLPGERMTPAGALGIALGFCGVAVIYSTDFSLLGGRPVFVASLVMLLSPAVSAIASVAVKRYGKGVHPLSLTAVPMGMTALLMGALAALLERGRPLRLDVVSVGAMLYLAVFGSAVTFTLYYWLLSHYAATRLSLIAYVIPVVAVFVGTVFLDETLTARTLVGSGLVVVGVAVTVQSYGAKKKGPPARGGP